MPGRTSPKVPKRNIWLFWSFGLVYSFLVGTGMPLHNSSSVVPPTPSTEHSCSTSQMSLPFSSTPLQLENMPFPLPSLRELLSASDQFDDDINDSDSDNDLSPILDAMTVSYSHIFWTSLILMHFHSLLDYSNSTESC